MRMRTNHAKQRGPALSSRLSLSLATILSFLALNACDDAVELDVESDVGVDDPDTDTGASVPCEGACSENEVCDEDLDACVCADGYVEVAGSCEVIVCQQDSDCDDGDLCNGRETCDIDANNCVSDEASVSCDANATCVPTTGECECDTGFVSIGGTCEAIACDVDADCDDGVPCNGTETCDTVLNRCEPGVAVDCGESALCDDERTEGDPCVDICALPQAPVLSPIDNDEIIPFSVAGDLPIEVAVLGVEQSVDDAQWSFAQTLDFTGLSGTQRVLARVADDSCAAIYYFDAVYDVQETYAPPAGQDGSDAVAADSEAIVAWASGWTDYVIGTEVDETWQTPEKAIGPIGEGGVYGVCVLGNNGRITLTFDAPITNGDGADFAVFENSFNDTFLEIGFVEVSSDGMNYVRFDSAYRRAEPVSGYGSHDPREFGGVAGRYRVNFGTPFDLEWLKNRPEVSSGVVDLQAITHVRIVDIVGDGSTLDSFGRPIYDPTPTWGSGGFDLSGVAVIHQLAD